MSDFTVVPVRTSGELKEFVNLPWTLYAGDPNWVPPLKKMVADLLTPGKHPFWEFAQRELFLLKRVRETVGRIAAIVDMNFNDYHQVRAGV